MWTTEYRVLYAKPEKKVKRMRTNVHYIYDNCYATAIKNNGKE